LLPLLANTKAKTKMVTLGLKKKMEEGGGFFRGSGKANNMNSPPTPGTPPISTPDSIKSASLTVPERPSVDTIEVPSPTRNNEPSRRANLATTASEGVSRVDSQVSELSSPEAGDSTPISGSGKKDPPAAMLRTTSIEPDHQSSGQASGGEQSSGIYQYSYHRSVMAAAAANANNHDPPEDSIVTKVLGIVDLSCGTSTPTPTRDIRQVLSFQPEWGVKPDPDEETLVGSLVQQKSSGMSVSDYHQNQAAQFPQANIQAIQADQQNVGASKTVPNANANGTLAEASPVAKASPGRGKRHENFELVYKEPENKTSPSKKGVMGKLVQKFGGGGGGGGGNSSSSSKKSGGANSSSSSSKKKASASSSFTAEEPVPLGIARRDVAVDEAAASPSPDPVLMTSGNLGVGSPVEQSEETSMIAMNKTKGSGGGSSSSMHMPKVEPVVEPVEYQEPPPTEKTNRGIFRRKKKEDSSSPTKNNNATASDDPAATTTPNGDEADKQQMRFKKVLKSIKGSSKMPLEAITEEDGDDGAASYGETFVRVPGIQSADAFLSDKDLIGDEIVEEIYADLDKSIQAELEADHQPLLPKNDKDEMPKTEAKPAVAIEATTTITKQKTTAPKEVSPNITMTLKKKSAPSRKLEPVVEISRNRSWVERLGLKRSGSKDHQPLTDAEHKETPTTSDTSAESSSDNKFTTTAAAADKNGSSSKKSEKPMWKAVVDKNTGKTYYYHRKTRETTWQKPNDEEIVHASEKKGRNEKEIQAMLRSKEDSEPEEVWEKKKEIARMLTTMAPPNGTSVERLVTQFKGKEDQLLSQLRDLKESKPFDEPLTGPNDKLGDKLNTEMVLEEETPLVRTRTAASIYSGFSGKSRISDKTEQIKNTSKRAGTGGLPRAATAGSQTTSISSPGEQHPSKVSSPERIPKNIPVPRTRELNVEEFTTSDRIYRTRRSNKPVGSIGQPSLRTPPRPYHSAVNDNNYFGDNEFNDKDNHSYATDSISALSDADLSSLTDRKEQVVDVRRRALDRAIAQEDWELAAHLSESLRTSSNYKSSGVKREIPREWAQSEVDRSILENDWDAVTAYIAQVRTKAEEAERAKMSSHLSSTSSRLKTPPPITSVASASSPLPMALPQQQQLPPQARTYAAAVKTAPSNVSDASSNPQKRFGARSQLQHEQLNTSVDSYSSGYSTYDSEYTSASSYTDEDAPRPAAAAKPKAGRPRPKEFAC